MSITDTGGGLKHGDLDIFVGYGMDAYKEWLGKRKISSRFVVMKGKDNDSECYSNFVWGANPGSEH